MDNSQPMAFHGSLEVKDKYLSRVRKHIRDREVERMLLVGPWYEEKRRGTPVGCTIHENGYSGYVQQLGIPVWIAELEDWLFLRSELDVDWPEIFLASIPVGITNWDEINHAYCHWLLTDPVWGVISYIPKTRSNRRVRHALWRFALLHRDKVRTRESWRRAGRQAWDAARHIEESKKFADNKATPGEYLLAGIHAANIVASYSSIDENGHSDCRETWLIDPGYDSSFLAQFARIYQQDNALHFETMKLCGLAVNLARHKASNSLKNILGSLSEFSGVRPKEPVVEFGVVKVV